MYNDHYVSTRYVKMKWTSFGVVIRCIATENGCTNVGYFLETPSDHRAEKGDYYAELIS